MSSKYQISVITPPVSEVLTLDEVKLHLKVDSTDDDTLITSLIVAAREYCEKWTNRKFMNQTLSLSLDNFYDWNYIDNSQPIPWYQYIQVPYPPCTSIVAITYLDLNGALQTLSTSIYTPDYVSEPARIYHAYNQAFPLVRQVPNSVFITFQAGYADAASVPNSLKVAMKLLIGTWYDNRSSISDKQSYVVPQAAESLLSMYRIMDI